MNYLSFYIKPSRNALKSFNKYFFHHSPKNKSCLLLSGQSLVEVIITAAIVVVLFSAIYALFSEAYQILTFSTTRLTGLHLAEEKLEVLKNMPYDLLGTDGGIPSGNLPQSEPVTRNNLNYLIKTSIVYIDDPFDQIAPQDLLPTDYKRIRIEVSWEGIGQSAKNPIILISDVSPNGLETTTGGGTLLVSVMDANAVPVPEADVTVVASTNPAVNLSIKTNASGQVLLPGAPPCSGCYRIMVSKNGFSSDRTYSTTEVANPVKPHVSIIAQRLSEISFAIDHLSSMTIHTLSSQINDYVPLSNIGLSIRGDKIIGTDTQDLPVYKYQNDVVSDSTGTIRLTGLEWDNYHPEIINDYYIYSGYSPNLPIKLFPAEDIPVNLMFSPKTQNSLLVTFFNATGNRVATVAAELKNSSGTISGETNSPDFPDLGQIFFSGLGSTDYNFTATSSAYATYSAQLDIDGNRNENIILNLE